MLKIPALMDGRSIEVQVSDDALALVDKKETRQIKFADVSAAHVKNDTLFLLKLRLPNDAVILQFPAMGARDLTKALVLSGIAPFEDVRKAALESSVEAKALYTSLKRAGMKDLAERAVTPFESDSALYTQRIRQDIWSKDFLGALTQPLVDAFLSMGCTLRQFYNIFVTTYFYNIANPRVSLDRLLAERIRAGQQTNTIVAKRILDGQAAADGASGVQGTASTEDCPLDYATRINSYGLMAVGVSSAKLDLPRETRKKDTNFEPIVPYMVDPATEQAPEPVRNTGLGIRIDNELHCEFEPKVVGEQKLPTFCPKDFELARDICRVVYASGDKEITRNATEISNNFKEMILGQYGNTALQYAERLLPSFYIKKQKQ